MDLKTLAFVLRRTNYGEADRILNLITPEGKISAIVKGVRKPKSKLAGGVEMMALVEVVVHKGKSEMGTVTSARMIKYYDKIVAELMRMEMAAEVLKKVSLAAEQVESPEHFKIVQSCFEGLQNGADTLLVESYLLLNLMRAGGEEVNLYRDVSGEKLKVDARYDFDAMEGAFCLSENGNFGVDEIKLLRLILSTDLKVVMRVKNVSEMVPTINRFAKIVSKTI